MEKQNYQKVITSKRKLFDLKVKETFRYKDLILLFVKRDFVAQYKQTILGPLWAIIQPLLTTLVFTVIFGTLANLTTLDVAGNYVLPAFLFYMAGNICWNYFSQTLSATSKTFINNRATMSKVYYPRLVSPIATTISNLISFTIQFMLFIIIWAVYLIVGGTDITITPKILLIFPTILQLMLLSLGCGIIISSVTTKYRDLAMLVSFGLQLWLYASPIAYGLELINANVSHLTWLYMLNPIAPIVTTFRYGVFGFGYFNLTYYLISWGITLLIFFIGLLSFSRVERNFADTI